MPEKRTRYDEEFRAGAARIVAETGKPITQVAGISGSTRAPWATGSPETARPASAPRVCLPVTSLS